MKVFTSNYFKSIWVHAQGFIIDSTLPRGCFIYYGNIHVNIYSISRVKLNGASLIEAGVIRQNATLLPRLIFTGLIFS